MGPGMCAPSCNRPMIISHNSCSKKIGASLVAQSVKNLPAMQAPGVASLGWEVPLEKEMATHSSILA